MISPHAGQTVIKPINNPHSVCSMGKSCCIANYDEMLMFYIFNFAVYQDSTYINSKTTNCGAKVGAKTNSDKNVLDYVSHCQHWFEYPLSADLCNLNYAVWSCLIVTLNSRSRDLTGLQTT